MNYLSAFSVIDFKTLYCLVDYYLRTFACEPYVSRAVGHSQSRVFMMTVLSVHLR